MSRDPRYDILFEPVKIGPVTAPNRFYQTPHATGMGWRMPKSSAAIRKIKAEGGWGVVCTEYCSIHPSSDDFPFGYLSLWDEDDMQALAKTADAIHRRGSLMGVELWHGGFHTNNRLTREPTLSPSGQRPKYLGRISARAVDKADIRDFRRWHREAAQRAKRAGADIVYVYAGHGYLPFQFLSPRTNRRNDEYGGNVRNRTRLIAELLEETRETVAGTCAVAIRLGVDELLGSHGITFDGDGREIVSLLAELPDLWDVNIAGTLGDDSRSARFSDEGFQESYVSFVKKLTTKPVVGVGRFTSPDAMVSQIRRGILDFIGAARPSIADPFLPVKICEGHEDEIRECIGCNICRAANNEGAPIRCTQNPTMGEEWRRGWHPERIAGKSANEKVLIVGAGPAGLECALALGKRGYEVVLAEASRDLGGRILQEAALPGLSTWIRVRDHREYMIGKSSNVAVYRESRMTAEDVLSLNVEHVVIATGSRWRRDGIGIVGEEPIEIAADARILTPDDVVEGTGPIILYDDDHYAVGSALAEKLRNSDHDVTYVTPQPIVAAWTQMTDEQHFIQERLFKLGIDILVSKQLQRVDAAKVTFTCTWSGRRTGLSLGRLVLVTGKMPNNSLYDELKNSAALKSITRIGDCLSPAHIADAVFSGHRYAREFGEPPTSLRRERPPP